jgi:hypothetical protein
MVVVSPSENGHSPIASVKHTPTTDEGVPTVDPDIAGTRTRRGISNGQGRDGYADVKAHEHSGSGEQ